MMGAVDTKYAVQRFFPDQSLETNFKHEFRQGEVVKRKFEQTFDETEHESFMMKPTLTEKLIFSLGGIRIWKNKRRFLNNLTCKSQIDNQFGLGT